MKTKPQTKNPIRDKTLRHPGQSLDEKIEDMIGAEAFMYVFLPVMTIFMALYEWFRWYMQMPYSPGAFSLVAFIILLISIYKIVKIKKKLRLLKQGRDGERAVGQYLETLREDGAKVFHDIVGDGFNIDHVVISPNGIFTVETKTYSKPAKGRPEVKQCGNLVTIDGHVNPDISTQVKAQAHYLKMLLRDISGHEYSVKPTVVFPGWFVETDYKTTEMTVLNPQGIKVFIAKSQVALSPEQVQMLSNGLARHIRNSFEKK